MPVLIISPSDAILWWGHTTELEEFVDKTVRGLARAQTDTRGGATKKHEISRTLLSINLHLYCMSLLLLFGPLQAIVQC